MNKYSKRVLIGGIVAGGPTMLYFIGCLFLWLFSGIDVDGDKMLTSLLWSGLIVGVTFGLIVMIEDY